jgi:hypothetical protein
VIGFPEHPHAITPWPSLVLPRWSAGVHMVTDVSLLVMPHR